MTQCFDQHFISQKSALKVATFLVDLSTKSINQLHRKKIVLFLPIDFLAETKRSKIEPLVGLGSGKIYGTLTGYIN